MKRSTLAVSIVALSLIVPLLTAAQPGAKQARIGVLWGGETAFATPYLEAARRSLIDLGYVEGKDFVVEVRFGERKPGAVDTLAADLVQRKVDVIVAAGDTSIHAARRATTTIPIVMIAAGDAVGSGLAASVARPGGNVTGMTFLTSEARKTAEFEQAFKTMADERIQAVVLLTDPVMSTRAGRVVADFALKHRLPMMCDLREFTRSGALMSYGPSLLVMAQRSAGFVDKILKGARPGDLPIEQPTKFELVLNLNTAKAIGVTVPPSLFARADEVIE